MDAVGLEMVEVGAEGVEEVEKVSVGVCVVASVKPVRRMGQTKKMSPGGSAPTMGQSQPWLHWPFVSIID